MPWRAEVLPYMPPAVASVLQTLSPAQSAALLEVRIRVNRPVEWVMSPGVDRISSPSWIPDALAIRCLAQGLLEHSAYAHQEDVRQGFLTLRGGHRVGLCGRVSVEHGTVMHMHDFSSISVRIARPILGSADWLMPILMPESRRLCSTLLFSAPGLGKTTVLRDAVRQLSDLFGMRVGVVDERSEIAGMQAGVPQMDIGTRTDVLDACPKAVGMMLLLRSMSPECLAVDEIGRAEDADALLEAAQCGVPVLATAHAGDLETLLERPMMQRLLNARVFAQYVQLGSNASANGRWDARAMRAD